MVYAGAEEEGESGRRQTVTGTDCPEKQLHRTEAAGGTCRPLSAAADCQKETAQGGVYGKRNQTGGDSGGICPLCLLCGHGGKHSFLEIQGPRSLSGSAGQLCLLPGGKRGSRRRVDRENRKRSGGGRTFRRDTTIQRRRSGEGKSPACCGLCSSAGGERRHRGVAVL